ncbi:TQXA domain-containing protein [Streptomyces triticagri]|uniref:TQXA domain-containing protein n=1 Tax=Streptomyces triticagri TaxID=2293568 RepID=A0A372MDC0_9ACTN|nr:TQXA domain-containing protein [Streptomyces triticagri]
MRAGGRRSARLTVTALLAAGLALPAATGASAADGEPQRQGGATATLVGLKTYDQAVVTEGGAERRVPAGLFEMAVDEGGTLRTYCVDMQSPTQKDAEYQETPWSGTSLGANEDAGRIRWIVRNSYPQVNDLTALAEKSGSGTLTEQAAAAGTQVAIWRYSDKADIKAVDPHAEKLADYLEKKARKLPEPEASLALDPPAVSGRPGERLGPVTVRTDVASVDVSPAGDAAANGVEIVDKAGRPVSTAKDGGQLYFDVPEGASAGSAALQVQATTKVPAGRAFASGTRSQAQILAGASEATVSAAATANWADKGAIPALTARENCAAGGVDITASNPGDEAFTFRLMDTTYTIEAGDTETVTVPLQEDQAYDFTVTGPHGFEKRFTGVLDCLTVSGIGTEAIEPASGPSPASAGGTALSGADEDLAETGGSNATPLIGGIAVALVVVGGAVVFLLRRKQAEETGAGATARTTTATEESSGPDEGE